MPPSEKDYTGYMYRDARVIGTAHFRKKLISEKGWGAGVGPAQRRCRHWGLGCPTHAPWDSRIPVPVDTRTLGVSTVECRPIPRVSADFGAFVFFETNLVYK